MFTISLFSFTENPFLCGFHVHYPNFFLPTFFKMTWTALNVWLPHSFTASPCWKFLLLTLLSENIELIPIYDISFFLGDKGIEPGTSHMQSRQSTTELLPHPQKALSKYPVLDHSFFLSDTPFPHSLPSSSHSSFADPDDFYTKSITALLLNLLKPNLFEKVMWPDLNAQLST